MTATERNSVARRADRATCRLGGWLLCPAVLFAGAAQAGEETGQAPSMELLEFLGSWGNDAREGEWLETLDLFLPSEEPDERADERADELAGELATNGDDGADGD